MDVAFLTNLLDFCMILHFPNKSLLIFLFSFPFFSFLFFFFFAFSVCLLVSSLSLCLVQGVAVLHCSPWLPL